MDLVAENLICSNAPNCNARQALTYKMFTSVTLNSGNHRPLLSHDNLRPCPALSADWQIHKRQLVAFPMVDYPKLYHI